MYGSALTYSRIRNGYDDERIGATKTSSAGYPWHSSKTTSENIRSTNAMTSGSSGGSHTSTPARRNRYSRASTTSVTQLLSDSCTNLLQKLTTRVRGPSATIERTLHNNNYLNNANNLSNNVSTRSRLEDKYTAVLDKIYGKKRTQERTLEPSAGRTLAKSATTTNILLAEKAYPYVSLTNSIVPREKTPYRSETKTNHTKKQYPEPPYSYLDRDSVYRVRQRSSNHSELRPRRSSKPQRSGKSENTERRPSNSLKLFPIDIPIDNNERSYKKPVSPISSSTTSSLYDKEKTPTNVDPVISEREAKRKEIQSLIMKYSALDEAYNRSGINNNNLNNSNCSNSINNNNNINKSATSSNASSLSSASVAVIPNVATSSSIAHKYNTRLTSAVSKRPFE